MPKLWELFSKPGTWTQGAMARDKNGQVVGLRSDKACCWCLRGGFEKLYGEVELKEGVELYDRIGKRLGWRLMSWNDHSGRTREEVVQLCKELDI